MDFNKESKYIDLIYDILEDYKKYVTEKDIKRILDRLDKIAKNELDDVTESSLGYIC